jgi:uncharacterized protein (DUF58 family)
MRPTGRFLLLLGLGLPIAALPAVLQRPEQAFWWLVWLAACALAASIDALWSAPSRAIAIALEVPATVPLGDAAAIVVRASASRRVDVEVRLALAGDAAPLPAARLAIAAGSEAIAALPLVPHRRGELRLQRLDVGWHSPLGLWWRQRTDRLAQSIIVAANVAAVQRRAVQMVQQRQFQTGLQVERHLGDGTDFDSLREFVGGMDRRSIDWKATARHREVLSRQFRVERDQAVLLCVDTGRLMGEPNAGLPKLDHAIHGALQLAWVCLRTGDRVGLYAFADQPQKLLLPQAGLRALPAIRATLARLDYSAAETNFTLAMTDLLQRLRRRTLVVLFTDFVDSVTAELMLRNLRWLCRRHVLLFVALRDPLLPELVERAPRDADDVHRAIVADELQRERALVLERIRAAGAQVLDVLPHELERGLIQRYLAVKRRELL